MNILLFGATGQVGQALQQSLAPLGRVIACDRARVDLTHISALETLIHETAPDLIVNAAAYTQVDKAEEDMAQAYHLNAVVPGVMAHLAAEQGALLVHYSTDYVFDGTKDSPYLETDPVNPVNRYGITKAQGEEKIRASGCKHLILRTSWVFSAQGHNFLRTILRLAKTNEQLRIVDDQIGAPTSAELIAQVTAKILLNAQEGGTYHLTSQGACSWRDFAECIVQTALNKGFSLAAAPERVLGIPSSDYPTPAKRPMNSRLSTRKIQESYDLTLPDWQTQVDRLLNQITP